MNKMMTVAALGLAMLVGCNCPNKDKDMDKDMSGEPKKMSVDSKGDKCPASCDKSAKAK